MNFGIAHDASDRKKKKKKKKKKKTTKESAWLTQWMAPNASPIPLEEENIPDNVTAPSPANPTIPVPDTDDAKAAAIRRHVNTLAAPSSSDRHTALVQLLAIFTQWTDAAAAQDSFSEALKPILKRVADAAEKCRLAAGQLLLLGLQRIVPRETLPQCLPFIIPILVFRMAPSATVTACEPSEEVRLVLVTVVQVLIDQCASHHTTTMPPPKSAALSEQEAARAAHQRERAHLLIPHFTEVCAILLIGFVDRHHDVQIHAGMAARTLATHCPRAMQTQAKDLIEALMRVSLQHRLSRVRRAAVETLRALVVCGGAESIRTLAAFREYNVIDIHAFYHGEARVNYMALLVDDGNVLVRRAFCDMVCAWMEGALRERFDYETLLMPYVLSGLGDADEVIVARALRAIRVLGAEYEHEREEDLRDEKFYAKELTPLHLADAALSPLLPKAFNGVRPALGERRVVRRFVGRLLPAICTELSDWKSRVQLRSVCLLRALLVYTEDRINQYLPRLVSAMERMCSTLVCQGQGGPLMRVVEECIVLIARFASPEVLITTLTNDIVGIADGEDAARAVFASDRGAAALVVLRLALRGLPREGDACVTPAMWSKIRATVDDTGTSQDGLVSTQVAATRAALDALRL